MEIISNSEIFLRIIITLILAFSLWLERELKSQPAWLRTHILIWVWACLLMILSIMVPELYNSNINDPWRIAAQVVSWIGFLWAGAIMKFGSDTRGLTTAANIWVTAAIGMLVWAWMYHAAFIATTVILFNLIIITKIKERYIVPSRFCTIEVDFSKKKGKTEEIYEKIKELPLKVITKTMRENKTEGYFKIISRIKKNENLFKIKHTISKIVWVKQVSISESVY